MSRYSHNRLHSRHHSLSLLHLIKTLSTKNDFDASVKVIQERIDGSNIGIVEIDNVIYAAKHIHTPTMMEQREVIEEWEFVRDLKLLGYHHLFNDMSHKSMIIIQDYMPCNLMQYISNQSNCKPKSRKHRKSIKSIKSPTNKRKSSKSNRCSYPHLTELEAKHIALSVLIKLKKMHKFGIVHCDVKPESIMKRTSVSNNAKRTHGTKDWNLVDFGLRTRFNLNKGYSMNTWRGTIAWAAPELIPNNGRNNRCGPELDVWGMGLVILYMVIGENPFELTIKECKDNKIFTLESGKKYWYHTKLEQFNQNHKWNQYLTLLPKQNKISPDLMDLLLNHMLVFDAAKRSNVKTVLKHKWFKDVLKIKNINSQKRFIIGK
eukprot:114592_1